MAVLPFDPVGVSDSDAQTVTVLFETGLLNTGIFNIIEQNKLKEILDAQAFSISACTDDACAIEVGELLSAEQIVLGSFSKVGTEFIINAKIIDVAKGSHLKADKISFSELSDLTDSVDLLAYKMAGLTYKQGGQDRIANNFIDVLITTVPPGAEIYINGIQKGVSPDLFSKLPMGMVRIEARKDNKYAFEDIDITEETEEINLKLSVQHGNLFIKTNQQRINVYIDDKNMGNIGNGLFRGIPAGERSVELMNEEYYWQDTVFIEPDVSTKVEVTLSPNGFVLFGLPAGVSATVTGENVSEKIRGTGELRLLEGNYTIAYGGDNYVDTSEEISVYRGQKIELKPVLRHTQDYTQKVEQQTYNELRGEISVLEDKYAVITYPEIDEYIKDVLSQQERIINCRFNYPDLQIRAENLVYDAEGKKEELKRREELGELNSEREKLKLELSRLEKNESKYQFRRVFWGMLSAGSAYTAGYCFYKTLLIDKSMSSSATPAEKSMLEQEKSLYELGTYSLIGTGIITTIVTVATPTQADRIIRIKEKIKENSLKAAALEMTY